MTWGSRRKLLYIAASMLVLGSVGTALFYTAFSKEPTCFDGAQNGTERGVDCGGACALICRQDIREPVVVWARSFAIAPGIYSAAAYIDNPNAAAKARSAKYVFKLFDEKNILVAERYGEVTIDAQQTVPVVETNISTGNRIPIRTFFEFTEELSWEREEKMLKLRVVDEILKEGEGRFQARVLNDAREEVRRLIVPVVLFDAEGNAQAASKSVIDVLRGGASEQVIYTWPMPLPSITRAEVIPYRAE